MGASDLASARGGRALERIDPSATRFPVFLRLRETAFHCRGFRQCIALLPPSPGETREGAAASRSKRRPSAPLRVPGSAESRHAPRLRRQRYAGICRPAERHRLRARDQSQGDRAAHSDHQARSGIDSRLRRLRDRVWCCRQRRRGRARRQRTGRTDRRSGLRLERARLRPARADRNAAAIFEKRMSGTRDLRSPPAGACIAEAPR